MNGLIIKTTENAKREIGLSLFNQKYIDLTMNDENARIFISAALTKQQATQLRDWLNEALEGME